MFACVPLNAQQLPFAHLSISDGLEDTVIFSIEQDDLGFLWLTTRTGINRFDGERFWTYTRADGLPHNLARDIYKAKDGKLWVASEAGIAWFDGVQFQSISKQNGWPENVSARAIKEAPDGTIWVATYGAGLLQFDVTQEPKIINRYDFKTGLPSDRVRSLFIDDSGAVWIGVSNKVVRIKDNQIEVMQWQTHKTEIRTIYQHINGDIWVGTRQGVAYLKDNAFVQLKFDTDLSQQTINTIIRDEKGHTWLGSRDFGVYEFSPDLKLISHMDMSNGLPDNSVNIIYKDKEKNFWFGTYGGGIARLSTSEVLNWKSQTGMSNPNVYAISEDQNDCVWIGTNGNGVSYLCDGKLTHFTRDDGLPHNKVLTTMIDRDGSSWFGTLQGLSHYKDNQFINFDQVDGLSGSVIYHIIQVRDGSYWIGTNNGLDHYVNGEFIQYNMSHGLPNNRINRIVESKNGALWLASSNGLTQFYEGKFTNWSTDDGLAANFINDFYEDEKGGLWIATNNGLSYFINNKFKTWTKKDGLPHSNCTTVFSGNNNDIWVGTSRGVAIFDGEDFTKITSREGLVFDLVNRGAGYKDSKGNLWFGTGEGISRFSSSFKPGNSNAPPVHLLSVINNNTPLLHQNSDIEIPEIDSSLTFEYTAISFQRAPDVNYRYRLAQNSKSPWRETRLRELQINSLAAGDYTFEVTARIGKGQWNPNPAQIRFTVTPPFWKTLWFLAIIIIGFLAAISYRSYRSRQRAIFLENTVKERTKQLEELNQGLDWLANHDNLTRLANRNQVHQLLDDVDRKNYERIGFIGIDLDYFKSINDQFGHSAGDCALKAFAQLLKDSIRKDQVAARWGGEEFLIICPNINPDRLQTLSIQILKATRNLSIETENNQSLHLKCSIGFAITPENQFGSSPFNEKTLQLTDMALYESKNRGRDRVTGFLWNTKIESKTHFDEIVKNYKLAIEEGCLKEVIFVDDEG